MKTKWFLPLGILCISGMLSATVYDDDREEEESSGGQNIHGYSSQDTSQKDLSSDFYRKPRNNQQDVNYRSDSQDRNETDQSRDANGRGNQNYRSDYQDRNFSDRNSNDYDYDYDRYKSRNINTQENYRTNN